MNPSAMPGAAAARGALPVRYFNAQLADAHPAHRAPIDIFGCLVGKVVPPDEKLVTPRRADKQRPSPRMLRGLDKEAAAAYAMSWEGVETRRSRDQAVVRLHPELADLSNPRGDLHRHAKDHALERIPALVGAAAAAEVLQVHGSEELPEALSQRFGKAADAQAGFPTPRFKGPVVIPPRQNVQANPDGILPPDSARHDQRKSVDRHYSVRQNFPVRKPRPPPSAQSMQNTPRRAAKPAADEEEPKCRHADTDIEYRDFGAEPTMPAELNRRAVQKLIRSKIHWARFEQVGKDHYVERTLNKKVAVSESRHANPDRDYNMELKQDIQAEDYALRKFQRIAQAAEKEKEKTRTVQERRSTIKNDYEQWRHSVAEKFDVELKRETALAQERARRQLMWVSVQAHITAARAFVTMLELGRLKRKQDQEEVRAVISMQGLFRMKRSMRQRRNEIQATLELAKRIKPYTFFMIMNFRARRRKRLTDLLRTFLTDLLKTNTVKRRISNYLYNVKRLQNAWRNTLRRQRARMLVLSRQWDRAFTLIRSKGKAGLLHDQNETVTETHSRNNLMPRHSDHVLLLGRGHVLAQTSNVPASSLAEYALDAHGRKVRASPNRQVATKADETEAEQKRVAFKATEQSTLTVNVDELPKGSHGVTPPRSVSAALSAHSKHPPHNKQGVLSGVQVRQGTQRHLCDSEWEQRLHRHNSLHVQMSAKELTMLLRISHYPVIKWQTLRYIFRRRRREYIRNVKQYIEDMVQYRSFMEQKRTVEQVIVAFAHDQDSGLEMAHKLLGNMAGSEEPKKPVFRAVIDPAEMQQFIAQGLQRLIHTSGQLREEAAQAEAALRQAAGAMSDTDWGVVRHQLHHHKPWWICHETYWHNFFADDPSHTNSL